MTLNVASVAEPVKCSSIQ